MNIEQINKDYEKIDQNKNFQIFLYVFYMNYSETIKL